MPCPARPMVWATEYHEVEDMKGSAARFSGRADEYVKGRPGYPAELLNILTADCGFSPSWKVVDLGCGTGKLAELFLANGNSVIGVEPNPDMRRAGEQRLGQWRDFRMVEGRAEKTGLPLGICDLVSAGQAFHWFDPERTRQECRRILKPGGWVAWVWNQKRLEGSPFVLGYEQLQNRYLSDLTGLERLRAFETRARSFFGESSFRHHVLPSSNCLTWEGLRSLLLSVSYVAKPPDPRCPRMLEELRDLFDRFASEGSVVMEYDTHLFAGPVPAEQLEGASD